MICGIAQGSMLGLDEQTEKLEADLKSLGKIDDSVGVKQSGELLSDDHDARHPIKSIKRLYRRFRLSGTQALESKQYLYQK